MRNISRALYITHTRGGHALPAVLLLAMLPALSGCGVVAAARGTDMRVVAGDRSVQTRPAIRTALYTLTDEGHADVYLTDLTIPQITRWSRPDNPGDTTTSPTGAHIVHLRVFVVPLAGSTPIDDTACNFWVRYAILTGVGQPEIRGLYSGGGFALPANNPGDALFSASVGDATIRLTHATPGFDDQLGTSTMLGRFSARRDPELAGLLAEFLDQHTRQLPERQELARADD